MARLIKQKDGRILLEKQNGVLCSCKVAQLLPAQQRVHSIQQVGFANQPCEFSCPLINIKAAVDGKGEVIVITCGGTPTVFEYSGMIDAETVENVSKLKLSK